MTRYLSLFIAALLVTPLALLRTNDLRADDDAALKVSELIGLYEVVDGEREGKKLPEERIGGTKVRFTEDRIVVTDVENKETYSATYKLDSSKQPAVITMTSRVEGEEGQVAKGLIQSEGGKIRLIYNLPGQLKAPEKFKTESGELMMVMKKLKE